MDWQDYKQWLSGTSGLDMDSLHIHVGVLAQVAVAFVLRLRLSSLWPWLAVAAAVLANEYYDFQHEVWPTREEQFFEGVKDVWNTMLLPTVLLLLARFTPRLFAAPLVADPGEASGEGSETGKEA